MTPEQLTDSADEFVANHTRGLILRLSAMAPGDTEAVVFAIQKTIEDAVEETRARFDPLIEAMDQLLDDMGPEGKSVCLAAKAQARVAFEPWLDREATPFVMPLDEARRVIEEVDRG